MIRKYKAMLPYRPSDGLSADIEGKGGAVNADGELILASTTIAPLGVIAMTQKPLGKLTTACIVLYGAGVIVETAAVAGSYAVGDYLAVNANGLFAKTTATAAVTGQVLRVTEAITIAADGGTVLAVI